MQICCENCKKIYSYEENDGLCPKCGCYNNISHQDAVRIEQERKARRYQRLAFLEKQGSLCDAEDVGDPTASLVYAPDCMEKNHSHSHAHTGGANIPLRLKEAAKIASKKKTTSKSTVERYLKGKLGGQIFFVVIWLIVVLTALIRFFAAAHG